MNSKQLNQAIRNAVAHEPAPAQQEPEPLILNGQWTSRAKPPASIDGGAGTGGNRPARRVSFNDLIRKASRG